MWTFSMCFHRALLVFVFVISLTCSFPLLKIFLAASPTYEYSWPPLDSHFYNIDMALGIQHNFLYNLEILDVSWAFLQAIHFACAPLIWKGSFFIRVCFSYTPVLPISIIMHLIYFEFIISFLILLSVVYHKVWHLLIGQF